LIPPVDGFLAENARITPKIIALGKDFNNNADYSGSPIGVG
jgi:hypothetical protein